MLPIAQGDPQALGDSSHAAAAAALEDVPMSPPPSASLRTETFRGMPPQGPLPFDDALVQVHESRTFQVTPAGRVLPHEQLDLSAVPAGIVDRLGQQYGPTGSRRVIRSSMVETPEKAPLRAEVERLQGDLWVSKVEGK